MTLDQQLTRAARQVADGVSPPPVDLDAVRSRARANRRRTLALAVTAVVVTAVAVGTAVGSSRDTSAPAPPARPHPSETVGALPEGMGDLPTGTLPLTTYWHDGVLHVRDVEIETPFVVRSIEAAGDTVMVGGQPDENGEVARWALVRGDRLEPLPGPANYYPSLSVDGRIAFWQTQPTPDTTRFVTWDTQTNSELASRTVPGHFDAMNRLQMVGVDADGIAYWVDESNPAAPVTRWDVRADTVEATDLDYDFYPGGFNDQPTPLPDVWVGFEDAYVSPDGTNEVFTGSAPGDSPRDCCTGQLRVRPVGPVGSVEPSDVITLQLPQGIPTMRLWDPHTDRGTWGVWWETNQTVLLDAFAEGHSHLVRCAATSGACEVVFDLGPNSSKGILYMPDWEQDWAFARFPLTE